MPRLSGLGLGISAYAQVEWVRVRSTAYAQVGWFVHRLMYCAR